MTYNKDNYIKEQTDNKKQLESLYTSFLEKKSLSDIMTIVCNAHQIHRGYSFTNSILAYCQGIDQEIEYQGILNSFMNWKKQGEFICKGQKGLKILVPIMVTKEDSKDDGKDNTQDIIRFFKIGNVFDISQTTAYTAYKIDIAEKNKRVYNNHELNFDSTLSFIHNNFNGDIVQDYNTGKCKGSFLRCDNTITLHRQSAHILLHEFGHYMCINKLKLLPVSGSILSDKDNNYAAHEILAEITAYIIMTQLDNNVNYNFNYSNLWSNKITKEFTSKEFNHYYSVINKAVSGLKGIDK